MVNDRFKKDLLVKFNDCCKMSKKPQGVNQEGWMSLLLQSGITKDKVSPKQLQMLFTRWLKEQQDGMDEIFTSDAKRGEGGEGEISYCDFVAALIKVSVLGKEKFAKVNQAD